MKIWEAKGLHRTGNNEEEEKYYEDSHPRDFIEMSIIYSLHKVHHAEHSIKS